MIGVAAVAVKVGVLAAAAGRGEVFLAKLRLFRVPELLAGSFLLALLAVTAAYFFTAVVMGSRRDRHHLRQR